MEAVLTHLTAPLSVPVKTRGRVWGEGEMARLMRSHDWSGSPMGEPANWPETLSTTVNLILASPVATSVYWGPRHALLYNDAYRKFMGERHPRSLGRPGPEVWREAWHIVGPQIEQTLATGEPFHGEGFHVPIEQDGRMVDHYWDYSFSPVYDSGSGRIVGVYNTSTNATAAFIAERERRALAERLQQVLECTSESVIMIGRDWRFTYLNRAAEIFSHPVRDLVGKVIWEALPGLVYDGSPNVYHYEQAMFHGVASEFESYYPEPINRWRHIQVRPTPEGIVLFARDTTEQKRADAALNASNKALAASEEELRWTVKMSTRNPWTADSEGNLLAGGDILLESPGRPSEVLLDKHWDERVHPEDQTAIQAAWRHSVRSGEPFDIEHRWRTSSGEYHWLRARAYPRRDADGKVVKWYGTTEDIHARKRYAETLEETAAALAASEEELRWTIQLNAQIPWTAGANGELLSISDRWYGLTGTKREAVLGSGWIGVQHKDDVHDVLSAWTRSVATGEPFDIEHRIRLASGEFCWIRSRAFPRHNAEGRIVRWYGIMEDIQARKLAEEGLRTTEKLAAVGRLATSIAHEINNPLEAVTNLLYLARTSQGLSEVLSYVETAEQELHRASVIANQTLRFQRQASAPIALYSDDLIENCLTVFQGKLQNSYVVAERRLRALQPVICYDGEIRQVFLNLVGNAIDAMQPGGGRLLIRTREATHPATGERGLVLTVADTGSGIPPEARRRLFEPFFTTKGIGGTGLGLWVSKDIVARHRGTLRLRSKPRRRKTDVDDGGTVFTLFLPYDALREPASSAAERLELAAA